MDVYCTGGRLPGKRQILGRYHAIDFVSRFNADLAFFSCRGVTPEIGITESTEDEAALKIAYMRNAAKVVLMCDSSKLGKQYFCKVGTLDHIWKLVTDIQLPSSYESRLSD